MTTMRRLGDVRIAVRGTAITSLFLLVEACTSLIDLDGYASDDLVTDSGAMSNDAPSGAALADVDAQDSGSDCSAPSFCDEFDNGPLGKDWASVDVAGGGTIALDPTLSVSAPNSILVTIPSSASAAERNAMLVREINAAKRVRCSFALYLDPSPNVDVLYLIASGPALSQEQLLLSLYTGNSVLYSFWTVSDGSTGTDYRSFPAVPTSRWTQVEFDIDFATSAKVRIDGVLQTTLPLLADSPSFVRVGIGGHQADDSGATRLHIDDVRCDITP